MEKTSAILAILITTAFFRNISAQQIFIDSDQSLGTNNSFSVQLGDLDGDGDLDAAVANPTSFIRGDKIYQNDEIWLNDGTGIFSNTRQQLGSSSKITLFDIDRDGDMDLIEDGLSVYNGPGGSFDRSPIRIWLNDGNANFTATDNYNFEGISIAFEKILNGDNQYEAVTLEYTGITASDSTILRIYSIDQPTCKLKNELTFKNFIGTGMATGDLDNDGDPDLFLTCAAVDGSPVNNQVWFNTTVDGKQQ